MRRLLFFLFSFPLFLYSQDKTERVLTHPGDTWNFDGHVTAEEYSTATMVTFFTEIEPNPLGTPPVTAKAYLHRTASALVIGVIAPLVDSTDLRANIQPRDQAWGDDFVGISLDLYGDVRSTFFLASNAYGVQLDLRNNNPSVMSDENFDVGYNINYETKAQIGDAGYTVEFIIPFSGLPFENKDVQKWGFGFFREYYVGAQRHQALSYSFSFDNPCMDCQFDDVMVLEGITSAVRREFIPYALGGASNATGTFESQGKAGATFFYGITPSKSVELTLFPDFSTVESDVAQIGVNSSFALFYPERRPFFNEGGDMVRTEEGLFYSRTLANPSALTKYISQDKDLRVYALAGIDLTSPYVVAGENRSHTAEASSNLSSVVRLVKPMKGGANFGFLNTNRIYKEGGHNNVMAVTARQMLPGNWIINGEYAWSQTLEPNTDWITDNGTFAGHTNATDGEQFAGFLASTQLQRNTTHWSHYLNWTHKSPTFQAHMGFIPQNNINETRSGVRYTGRPNGKVVKSYILDNKAVLNITPDGRWKNQKIEAEGFLTFGGNLRAGYRAEHSFMEEFEGHIYNNLSSGVLWISYSPVNAFSINPWIAYGDRIAYNAGVPASGTMRSAGGNLDIRLFGQVQWNTFMAYEEMLNPAGGLYYAGWVMRNTLRFNANRYVQARLVHQIDFDGTQYLQPLIQYQPSPFSIFYLGSSSQFLPGLSGTSHSLFAKAQWALDMNRK